MEFLSNSKGLELYKELKDSIDCIESEIQEIHLNLDDVQEKNFAFKFQAGSGTDAVKQGKNVKFDTQIYGTGVQDGVYTAPIGNNFKFHIL